MDLVGFAKTSGFLRKKKYEKNEVFKKKDLLFSVLSSIIVDVVMLWRDGRVWLKAHDWKSCWCNSLAGSNPVLSATRKAALIRAAFVFELFNIEEECFNDFRF